MAHKTDIRRSWARLGVLWVVRPATRTPDLERLLLDTARAVPEDARLFILSVSWLATYSGYVARHRLRRLIETTLEPKHQPALGLLLESAVELGALPTLRFASDACATSEQPGPLFESQSVSPRLRALADRHASPHSRKWGAWAPPVEPKRDAIRPPAWILEHNPGLFGRIVRKGDLRVSILETLRRDVPSGRADSEAHLARLCGATRVALREALSALVLEGEVTVGADAENDRDHPVALRGAA